MRFLAPFYPTWDHDLALQYLNQFDLPPRTKIRSLSKGQNVRLGLLLALAHRPELVVLDDPALGLDPIMRKQFNRDLITHLQGEGHTILYSSHLLHEVEPVADRVAILHRGRIIQEDATENLRHRVKRIVLDATTWQSLNWTGDTLDTQTSGDEVGVTLENADALIQTLKQHNTTHRVQELNLDEIFEAYVAGENSTGGGSTGVEPSPPSPSPDTPDANPNPENPDSALAL
jgi:ABC-2 type transport system ATP-binding protein